MNENTKAVRDVITQNLDIIDIISNRYFAGDSSLRELGVLSVDYLSALIADRLESDKRKVLPKVHIETQQETVHAEPRTLDIEYEHRHNSDYIESA